MNVLFIGDIIGSPGRKAVKSLLPAYVKDNSIDLVIANGENAAGGFGITEQIAEELFCSGIDVITSGNHIFDKKEVLPYLKTADRLIRPLNYPDDVPGKGVTIITINDNKVAILNISGLVFMEPIKCPFETIDKAIAALPKDVTIRIVDFHAEVTSEKSCMGWYLDGRVSAVLGTHTHIPTADARLLNKGTGYITDVGMTGPYDSVIGVKRESALRRFLTHMPTRFTTATGDVRLLAVILKINEKNGRCTDIQRVEINLGV